MRWLALVLEDLGQASGYCPKEKRKYTYADIKDLHVASSAKAITVVGKARYEITEQVAKNSLRTEGVKRS